MTLLAGTANGQDGWTRITPGGETKCLTGKEYSFFVRPADTTRVLFMLEGGGACWNGANCHTQRTAIPEVSPTRNPAEGTGLRDLSNPENPFARYTVVLAPYCSGDLHLGARDRTYTITDTAGTREIETFHRGLANAGAAVDWLATHIKSPSQIIVIGSSAGAVPTPFYGDLLQRRYPRARVAAIGDGAGMHHFKGSPLESGNWGLPGAVHRHAGWTDFPADWGTPDLAIRAVRGSPKLELYQIEQAWDQGQGLWVARFGRPTNDLPALLRANQAEIRRNVPSFRAFTLGGNFHTILEEPQFYSHGTNGVKLRDWIAGIERGEPVESVECSDCARPEIHFRPEHVAILDSAIRILADPARWDPTDVEQRCPEQPTTFTLRCAFFHPGALAPSAGPVYHEIYYAALARLKIPLDPMKPVNPLRVYNDSPGKTASDMVSLLEEVRTRVVADLTQR